MIRSLNIKCRDELFKGVLKAQGVIQSTRFVKDVIGINLALSIVCH